ncbi:MAG TPA: DUF5995 family protein [Longimicrobium sp.]|nr:DUF5995 family protein [Longimicrobium sp.]
MSALIPLLEAPYQTIDDVVAGITAVERHLLARRDRRAVFASAYLAITLAVRQGADDGAFGDNDWVRRYDVAFANLYRIALLDFERGRFERVPRAWRFSFETSLSGDSLVLQDLLLGINAHINHDLALALFEVSVDPRDRRHADHTKVNEVLGAATDALQDRIARAYAPALRVLDQVAGRLDEELAGFSVRQAREASWVAALGLANARGEGERAGVRGRLDAGAAVVARLVLSSIPAGTPLMRVLRELERQVPWWEMLELPLPSAPVRPAPVTPTAPAVADLDALVARLTETVARFDAARSRLSVAPSTFLLATRRLKEKLEDGKTFEDRDWVLRLNLHFASGYFRALEAHEAGRETEVPDAWKPAFAAAAGRETTLVQELALAMNARLNHDLPLALVAAGMDGDRERRHRDLLAFHELLRETVDPAQEMLAAKYSPLLRVLDVAMLRMDEALAGFSLRRARDAAWENAVRLADAGSEDERRALAREIDRRAAALGHRILLRGVVGGGWVARALRHVEDRFEGRWSAWVEPAGE